MQDSSLIRPSVSLTIILLREIMSHPSILPSHAVALEVGLQIPRAARRTKPPSLRMWEIEVFFSQIKWEHRC